jgi:hypothetical protein
MNYLIYLITLPIQIVIFGYLFSKALMVGWWFSILILIIFIVISIRLMKCISIYLIIPVALGLGIDLGLPIFMKWHYGV